MRRLVSAPIKPPCPARTCQSPRAFLFVLILFVLSWCSRDLTRRATEARTQHAATNKAQGPVCIACVSDSEFAARHPPTCCAVPVRGWPLTRDLLGALSLLHMDYGLPVLVRSVAGGAHSWSHRHGAVLRASTCK